MSALMQAVNANNVAQVRALIAQGVNVDEYDARGDAPLVIAAYKGYTEIVKALLDAGADLTVTDPGMKATALHAASYAGRTEAAKLLVQAGIDIDKQGPYNGYTALHDAIWQNNVEVARVLIDAGANLHLKNHDGLTAPDFAKVKNRREIVSMISRKIKN